MSDTHAVSDTHASFYPDKYRVDLEEHMREDGIPFDAVVVGASRADELGIVATRIDLYIAEADLMRFAAILEDWASGVRSRALTKSSSGGQG